MTKSVPTEMKATKKCVQEFFFLFLFFNHPRMKVEEFLPFVL